MVQYSVELINRTPDLSLAAKREAIEEVLRHICHGSDNTHVSRLHHYQDSTIHRRHIELTVDESSKSWRRSFGKILANEHGMRVYCDPKNQHRLFRWN